MLGVAGQRKRRPRRRGNDLPRDRPIIAGDVLGPPPPSRRLARVSAEPMAVARQPRAPGWRGDDVVMLRRRVAALEQTIVEIGHAAAEAAAADEDAPALAVALLELDQKLGEVQSRLDKIEQKK